MRVGNSLMCHDLSSFSLATSMFSLFFGVMTVMLLPSVKPAAMAFDFISSFESVPYSDHPDDPGMYPIQWRWFDVSL